MLSTFALAALLTLTDPSGDALGNGGLSTPMANAMRDREAFDILGVNVPEKDHFGLTVSLGRAPYRFPQAILEFYLSDADTAAGTAALLPGSGMRLPAGQTWRYAVRIIGNSVQLYEGSSGEAVQVTEAAGGTLEVSGSTLSLTTRLPQPEHFSLYGISGSFDPFSQTGWRQLREEASPWGYAGTQGYPVLDVVADDAALQTQALEEGVLPEIRAGFSENGWLLLSGAGVVLALSGLAARVVLGKREPVQTADTPDTASPPPERALATSLSPFDARPNLEALAALKRGEANLVSRHPALPPEPESVGV